MLGSLLGGRYKLTAVLGVGGFGQTFLAEDTQRSDDEDRRCVIKQFKPTSQDSKFLDVARRLFDTEVKTLEKLGQHPQIPDFLDFFEEADEFYLVQEFVEGQSLSYEFASVNRFYEEEAIALLKDVLGILDFVHANQVIHRDIKPGNLIRRQRDGKIVLIDFGAVKEIHTQLITRMRGELGQTNFTVGIGTQGYSPSEQLAGQPRFCSDIYALGVTVIQALTRLHPTQLPIDHDTGELVWQNYASISVGLEAILERMVRYHFSQRFQSTRDVLDALEEASRVTTETTEISTSIWAATQFNDQTQPQGGIKKPPNWMKDETSLEAIAEKPAETPKPWWRRIKSGIRVVSIATLAITGVVLGARQLVWLQPLELAAYDQWYACVRLFRPIHGC
ncbi:MAG: protein kinase [Cyanobacteria bacterium RU_5_0]|nr:protein kinase [Cyanobacteria bacterium RU_5_0]